MTSEAAGDVANDLNWSIGLVCFLVAAGVMCFVFAEVFSRWRRRK